MIPILYHVLALDDYGKRLGNLGTTKKCNGSSFLISMPHYTTRKAAAQMASGAQVFYLPVGTKHHFFELDQILSLLQKDLRGLVVRKSGSYKGLVLEVWSLPPFSQHFYSFRASVQ